MFNVLGINYRIMGVESGAKRRKQSKREKPAKTEKLSNDSFQNYQCILKLNGKSWNSLTNTVIAITKRNINNLKFGKNLNIAYFSVVF